MLFQLILQLKLILQQYFDVEMFLAPGKRSHDIQGTGLQIRQEGPPIFHAWMVKE